MDKQTIDKLRELSGIDESVSRIKFKDHEIDQNGKVDVTHSAGQSKAAMKDNNKKVKNKKVDDVLDDENADIAAELVDVDDSSITPKKGKTDAAGEKAAYKADPKNPTENERLNYTISVDSNGAPNVDDELDVEYVDVDKFGEFSEGYVLENEDGMLLNSIKGDQYGFSEDGNGIVFTNRDQLNKIAESMSGVTIKEAHSVVFDSQDFVSEVGAEVIVEFKMTDILSEADAHDIQTLNKGGDPTKVSIVYQGQTFTGYVAQVGNGKLLIQPTDNTRNRFKIQDKEVWIPANIEQLRWSDSTKNMLIGKATPIQDLELELEPKDTNFKPQPTAGQQTAAQPEYGPRDTDSIVAPNWSIQNSSVEHERTENSLYERFLSLKNKEEVNENDRQRELDAALRRVDGDIKRNSPDELAKRRKAVDAKSQNEMDVINNIRTQVQNVENSKVKAAISQKTREIAQPPEKYADELHKNAYFDHIADRAYTVERNHRVKKQTELYKDEASQIETNEQRDQFNNLFRDKSEIDRLAAAEAIRLYSPVSKREQSSHWSVDNPDLQDFPTRRDQ